MPTYIQPLIIIEHRLAQLGIRKVAFICNRIIRLEFVCFKLFQLVNRLIRLHIKGNPQGNRISKKANADNQQDNSYYSNYTDYDQLPLFLNAEMTAKLLGIPLSSAYELMHEEGFPALRIGNRIVVPKEKFCRWVDRQTGGAR